MKPVTVKAAPPSTKLTVEGWPNLDPVTIDFIDHAPGQGEITIKCWGQAWTMFWGAMGKEGIVDFILTADDDYLFKKLKNFPEECSRAEMREYTRDEAMLEAQDRKHDEYEAKAAYLRRVIAATRHALKEHKAITRPVPWYDPSGDLSFADVELIMSYLEDALLRTKGNVAYNYEEGMRAMWSVLSAYRKARWNSKGEAIHAPDEILRSRFEDILDVLPSYRERIAANKAGDLPIQAGHLIAMKNVVKLADHVFRALS